MEIESLRLTVEEADIQGLIARGAESHPAAKDIRVAVSSAGVSIGGNVALGGMLGGAGPTAFETVWELSAEDGKLAARLADLKAGGTSAGMLKGFALRMLGGQIAKFPWLSVDGDRLLLDLDGLLASRGLPSRTNLTAVRTETGRVVIEAGRA